MEALANAGAGALLAWVSLLLFARMIRRKTRIEPASMHRAQVAALACAAAMVVVPWLRAAVPARWLPAAPFVFELHVVAEPVSTQTVEIVRSWRLSPLAILGALWVLALVIAGARALGSALALRRLRRRARPASRELRAILCGRATARGMRTPELLVSRESSIPFVMGLCAPAVVLPEELLENLDQGGIELVLEHELEHVRRGDVGAAAALSVLTTVLAYHPVASRLAREAVLAREVAVDARVSKRDPRAYASLLVEIAAHAHFGDRPATVAIDDTALARRVAMLTDSPGPAAARRLSCLPLFGVAVAVLVMTLLAPTLGATPASPLGFRGGRGLGLRAAAPTSGSGLPDMQAPALLVEHAADVRRCYAEALRSRPALQVESTLTLRISESGHVEAATIPIPGAPSLQSCLERVATTWTLPAPAFIPPTAARAAVSVHVDLAPAAVLP